MDRLVHRVRGRVERGERVSGEDCRALLDVRDLNALSQLSRIVRERRFGTDAFFTVASPVLPEGTMEDVDAEEHPRVIVVRPQTGETDTGELCSALAARLKNDPGTYVRFDPRIFPTTGDAPSLGSLFEAFDGIDRSRILIGPGGAFSDDALWGETRISKESWLAVHSAAHEAGFRSDAGIVFHDMADPDQLVEFLELIRELQDRTGGFRSMVPLPFLVGGFDEEPHRRSPTAAMTLRLSALLRLFFDNIDHIATPVRLLDPEISFIGLSYGADLVDTLPAPVEAEADPAEQKRGELPVIPFSEKGAGEDLLQLVEERITEARFRPIPVNPALEKMYLIEDK